jgi:hypothetical protein
MGAMFLPNGSGGIQAVAPGRGGSAFGPNLHSPHDPSTPSFTNNDLATSRSYYHTNSTTLLAQAQVSPRMDDEFAFAHMQETLSSFSSTPSRHSSEHGTEQNSPQPSSSSMYSSYSGA